MTNPSDIDALIKEVAHPRIPSATYRLQFNRTFTFRDAQSLILYLDELGISDCYASPILQARAGSTHGYDIADHSRINPELGGEDDFAAFGTTLREHGMALVLDSVPNHMTIGETSNAWWMDVLENGPSSAYASFFDIAWHPVKPELENKVLLPILEEQYGNVLESGKLRLMCEDGAFFICYYQNKLPVAPGTYSQILGDALDRLQGSLSDDDEHLQELQSILTALSYLPPRTETDPDKIVERTREKEVIKRRIATLYNASAEVRAALDATIEAFNGTVGDPHSFDRFDTLVNAQVYRLAFWRVAAEEINYRRFFDINDLTAIRVERPEVFEAAHRVVFRLLREGKVTGLRIDHPDGLWDPSTYFRQLQARYLVDQVMARVETGVPLALSDADVQSAVSAYLSTEVLTEPDRPRWPLYVVAEKILSRHEPLPEDWAVYGTTGYDFLNQVNGIFIDSSQQRNFDKIYSRFIQGSMNFREVLNASKKNIMLVALSSEINSLSHQLERIAEKNRRYRDFTLNGLTLAIREVIAALPVYRTYVNALNGSVSQWDQIYVDTAVAEAKRRNPRTNVSLFEFVRDTLLLRNLQDFREEDRAEVANFVMRFQQVTGPMMAKGMEDTAFYIYNRLASLNEVGGYPAQFGNTVADFHQQNAERQPRWPHSMLASSTHDTKRSEDVRARINVLSEIPQEWKAALNRWSRLNASKKTKADGEAAPDRNDEYLLYQTLLGVWPMTPPTAEEYAALRERIAAYMHKATKEAKVHTSWINPNQAYDSAVRNFVWRLLPDGGRGRFLEAFLPFQRRVAYYGQFNSLSQLLLKLTAPGVPDIYQGTELWDLSLVDPDNRRPVDYPLRRAQLADLKTRLESTDSGQTALARELLKSSHDGCIKLYVTYRTLNFRRAHAELFSRGTYKALEATGARQDHVCAFARTLEDQASITVTPRLVVGLTDGVEQLPVGESVWKDTRLVLPSDQLAGHYRNLFTGEVYRIAERCGIATLSLAEVCGHFPVALLERIEK